MGNCQLAKLSTNKIVNSQIGKWKIVNWQNCQLIKLSTGKLAAGKLSTGKIGNWEIVNWQNFHLANCQLAKRSTGKLSAGKKVKWQITKWSTGKLSHDIYAVHFSVNWQSVAWQLCHLLHVKRPAWQVDTWQSYTGNPPLAKYLTSYF